MCTSTAENLKAGIISQNQGKSRKLYICLTFSNNLVIINIIDMNDK